MTIVFICGSLEQGKDGIGDYCRKLAQECFHNNVTSILVAVNDSYVQELQFGTENGSHFFRFPKKYSWLRKKKELDNIFKLNAPIDWVSLQFVSYAFNEKGIIWKEQAFFNALKNFNLHIMMHEIWVGGEKESSLWMKVLGFAQKAAIISLIKSLKPKVIQTSTPLYQKFLNLSNLNVSLLPLFSNINYRPTAVNKYLSEVPQKLQNNRNSYLIGCLFGSIYHDSWDLSTLFNALQRTKCSEKKILIVSIGKVAFGEVFWCDLQSRYSDIEFLTLGIRSEDFISYWLNHFVDFGIVTTPSVISGKSGSCMAFLEHGIPVYCKKNTLTFNFDVSEDLVDSRIIEISEDSDFVLQERHLPISQVAKTADSFVKTLKNF